MELRETERKKTVSYRMCYICESYKSVHSNHATIKAVGIFHVPIGSKIYYNYVAHLLDVYQQYKKAAVPTISTFRSHINDTRLKAMPYKLHITYTIQTFHLTD